MDLTNGFERLFCLDAHIQGKLLEIKIGENANLNGTNGAGKTTLLKLISFFYGAPLRNLVRRVGSRHNFVDWYLPRPTSLLIMEYSTEVGPACAVAYRNTTGDKPVFRFLAEPFKQEYFSEIRDGELKYVEGKALGRFWDMKQLRHSRQIEEVDNYRAIILADNAAINLKGRSKEYREYVHRYSLSNGRSSLRHIDKISAAILNRSADMDGMKDMIANIMEEDNVVLPPLDIHKGLVSEISQLKIIRDLEHYQDEFVSTIANGKSFRENKEVISRCVAELKLIHLDIEDKKLEADDTRKEVKYKLTELEDSWIEKESSLASKKADAKADAQKTERQINELDDEKREWENQDVDQKVAELGNLLNYERSLSQAIKVLEELENGVKDLVQFRDRRKLDEVSRHSNAVGLLENSRKELEQSRRRLEEAAQGKTKSLNQNLVSDLEKKRTDRQQGLLNIVSSLAAIQARISSPSYTEEEKLALHSAEEAYAEAELENTRALDEKDRLEKALNSSNKIVREAEDALLKARRSVESEKSKRDRIEELCNPKPGTFLSELRAKDDQWYRGLGKVINPQLLNRKDLDPVYLGENSNFMGWEVDLEAIDAPSWAVDMAELERQLSEQKTELILAEEHLEATEAILERAVDAKSIADSDYNEAKRLYHNSKGALASAKECIKSVKLKNNQSRDARLLEDRSAETSIKEDQNRYEEQTEKLCKDIQRRFDDALEGIASNLAADLVPIEEGLELNISSMNNEKAEHKRTLKTIKDDYIKQCAEKGVSEEAIERAITDEQNKRNKVNEVSSYKETVAKYERWLKREWSRQGELTDRLVTEQEVYSKAYETLENERISYKKEKNELIDQKKKYDNDIKDARDELDLCLAMLKRLPSSTIEIGKARDLDIVLNQCEYLLEEQGSLLQYIEKGIAKSYKVLARGDGNDKIGVAWNHKQQAYIEKLGEKERENPEGQKLATVDALEDLISNDLPMLKENLLNFVHNTGQNISRFYIGLKDVSKGISKQSARISEAVSKDIKFNAISDINLKLISRIDELEFWRDLEKFNRLWENWIIEGQRGLPPKEIDEQLVHVTQILSRSNTKTGLNAVFDLEVHLRENGRPQIARKDAELEEISSNGLSYLILVTILAGITRMLCPDQSVKIHWPMDELGVLHTENISKLFALLHQHRIVMVGGFPASDPNLLRHFKDHHQVKPGEGIVELVLEEDKLAALMMQKVNKNEEEAI